MTTVPALPTLTRAQLAVPFADPRTLLAFEAYLRQISSVIPDVVSAIQNEHFVLTVTDPAVLPNGHLITAGANITATAAPGTLTIAAVPSGSNGQLQYNNAGAFAGGNLSGDVTTSGSLATTISNNAVTTPKIADGAVTYAKMQNASAASVLLGRGAGSGAGVVQEITLGTGLSMSGTTLSASGSGTVTSVGLSMPAQFSVANSPVTTSGTLTVTWATQSANLVFAGPSSGAAAAPTFRALVSADLPVGSASQIGGVKVDGTTITASGGVISAVGAGGGTTKATPTGRLTLTSGSPVMSSTVSLATNIYYTPYIGNNVSLFDGSATWTNYPFTELTLVLDTTNHPLNRLFDVFVWNNGGTIAVGAGPQWSRTATVTVSIASPAVISWTGHGLSEGQPVIFTTTGALPTGITAGTQYQVGRSPGANSFNIATTVANAAAGTFVNTSGSQSGTQTATNSTVSRGTGSGTSELALQDGLWVNKNAVTLTNGAGAGTSVAAGKALYVGTFYTVTAGHTSMDFIPAAASGGALPSLVLWNAYNRVRVTGMNQDSAGSWSYASTTWRAADNSIFNRVTVVDGLAQSAVTGSYFTAVAPPTAGAAYMGISQNSTTTAPRITTQGQDSSANGLQSIVTPDVWTPMLGLSYYQAQEASTGTSTWFGAQTSPTRQLNALTINLEM